MSIIGLTLFNTIIHFYTHWKCQKAKGFLTSGGIEIEHWGKLGKDIKAGFDAKFLSYICDMPLKQKGQKKKNKQFYRWTSCSFWSIKSSITLHSGWTRWSNHPCHSSPSFVTFLTSRSFSSFKSFYTKNPDYTPITRLTRIPCNSLVALNEIVYLDLNFGKYWLLYH